MQKVVETDLQYVTIVQCMSAQSVQRQHNHQEDEGNIATKDFRGVEVEEFNKGAGP
jgi:hypothetical protein